MLITSVMLATKFFDDETFNNLYYAKVGGLQVTELNQLEEKFLSLIDFSLTIQGDTFQRYHCELAKHAATPIPKASSPTSKKCPEINVPASLRSSCPGTTSVKVASCVPPHPMRSSAPVFSRTPALVRNVCEALICESTNDMKLQARLIARVSELLLEEEKYHNKVSPSAIKILCSKIAAENGLSHSFVARAAAQAERLERLEKMENTNYSSSYDYAGRDCIASPMNDTKYSAEAVNTLQLGSVNITSTLTKTGVPFSQCLPNYSNNSRNMVAVTWG